jgi:DNA-binding response OmpR family regulator
MPGHGRFDTCRQIRNDVRLRRVPIAFPTSRQTPEGVRTGMAAGGNDFILKPFDHALLIGRVHHWTRQHIGRL